MEFLGFNKATDIFTQLFRSSIGTSYWIDKKYLHTFNFGITEKTEIEEFMDASLPHKAKTPLSIKLLDVCTRGNSWIYYFAGDLEMGKTSKFETVQFYFSVFFSQIVGSLQSVTCSHLTMALSAFSEIICVKR